MATQLQMSLQCGTQHRVGRTQNSIPSVNGNVRCLAGSKASLAGTRLMASGKASHRSIHRLVAATAAPAAPGTSAVASVDENAILDTVIVGAGVSGLTTAMVRCNNFLPMPKLIPLFLSTQLHIPFNDLFVLIFRLSKPSTAAAPSW